MDFQSENCTNPSTLNNIVKQNLKEISSEEIQSIVNRIGFYLEHFSIISKKRRCRASEQKVMFLRKVKNLLNDEMETRTVPVRY